MSILVALFYLLITLLIWGGFLVFLALLVRGPWEVWQMARHPQLAKNHALEHATSHILAQEYSRQTESGVATGSGFYLMGEATGQEVARAVHKAKVRLINGEEALALHPQCGTGRTVAISAGLALGLLGGWWVHWGLVFILGGVVARIGRVPLGIWAQRHWTTSCQVQGVRVGVPREESLSEGGFRVWVPTEW